MQSREPANCKEINGQCSDQGTADPAEEQLLQLKGSFFQVVHYVNFMCLWTINMLVKVILPTVCFLHYVSTQLRLVPSLAGVSLEI